MTNTEEIKIQLDEARNLEKAIRRLQRETVNEWYNATKIRKTKPNHLYAAVIALTEALSDARNARMELLAELKGGAE